VVIKVVLLSALPILWSTNIISDYHTRHLTLYMYTLNYSGIAMKGKQTERYKTILYKQLSNTVYSFSKPLHHTFSPCSTIIYTWLTCGDIFSAKSNCPNIQATVTLHSIVKLLSFLFLTNNHFGNIVGQDQGSEKLTRENKTSRNNTYDLIINCLYGRFLGL